MKTDRELLELAAKAEGHGIWIDDEGSGLVFLNDKFTGVLWNPLHNDGDALRLASKLRLMIKPGKHLGDGCTVESQQSGIAGCTCFRDDPAEQMRVAIVRAAASIGEQMP